MTGVREAMSAVAVAVEEPQSPVALLDITPVWERKLAAMRSLGAQGHLVEYYTDLGRRRGVQAERNSGPNPGLPVDTFAEAYQRVYPQVTSELA